MPTGQYKLCPECQAPADLHAPQCLRCGRLYQTHPVPPVPSPSVVTPTPAQFITALVTALVVLIFLELMTGSFPLFSRGQSVNVIELQSKVSLWMDQSQVQQALGDPSSTQQMNSGLGQNDFWYYEGNGGMLQITFNNGRVNSINRY